MNEIVANKDMAEAAKLLETTVELRAVNPGEVLAEGSKAYIDSPEATSAEEPVEAVAN